MKLNPTFAILLVSGSLLSAQDVFKEAVKMGFSDVAATKQKAEAGDAGAQLSYADTLSSNFKKAEALRWYRKAAEQGIVEAKCRLGEMLLFGDTGIPSDQTVKANPSEGIRWTFEAATNRNAKAFLNMSKAFDKGVGLNTNMIQAYAWLQLYADNSNTMGRVLLNQMALKLDTKSLSEAKALATQFNAGHWPTIHTVVLHEGDSRLKLSGVTLRGKNSMAIINGRTLAEDETALLNLKETTLKIRLLKINADSVLIQVEGEDEPRLLRLK